jgi:3-deoxy-manno-octulosonate cytidylyltransferase (CMP-KDO synthetase)
MIVAIIPARFASTRLTGKPLADINGRPMIQHVYERVGRATLVDSVMVATDDERIANAVMGFGGTAVMTPAAMNTGTDRIALVAHSLPSADIIVNVQGDEPLIAPEMVDEAIRPLIEDSTVAVGTLIRKIDSEEELRNPGVVKVVRTRSGRALFFSRSVIPFSRDTTASEALHRHTYYKHIGLYVFRRDFLVRFPGMQQTNLELAENLEQLRILEHGYSIVATITEHDSITVDTAEDLERVRSIVQGHG